MNDKWCKIRARALHVPSALQISYSHGITNSLSRFISVRNLLPIAQNYPEGRGFHVIRLLSSSTVALQNSAPVNIMERVYPLRQSFPTISNIVCSVVSPTHWKKNHKTPLVPFDTPNTPNRCYFDENRESSVPVTPVTGATVPVGGVKLTLCTPNDRDSP